MFEQTYVCLDLKYIFCDILHSVQGIDTMMKNGCATGTNYQFCDAYRTQQASSKDSFFQSISAQSNNFIGNQYKYSVFYVSNSLGSFKNVSKGLYSFRKLH